MAFHLAPSIMVIDSEVVSRTSCSNFLERAGFIVIAATSGDDAMQRLKRLSEAERPNLIVVDNALSDLAGIELCKMLRSEAVVAQILLIVKKEDIVDLATIEKACDGFMVRPFHHIDLSYKIKLLLSRTKPNLQSKILEFGDIKLNLTSYKVTRKGRFVHLGPTEFRLLQCFLENPTKVFSRDHLINYVWTDRTNVEYRTIDVHINRLRTALKLPGDTMHVIKTIRAAGYCLHIDEKLYINA